MAISAARRLLPGSGYWKKPFLVLFFQGFCVFPGTEISAVKFGGQFLFFIEMFEEEKRKEINKHKFSKKSFFPVNRKIEQLFPFYVE